MEKPNLTDCRKILGAFRRSKKKVLSLDALSRVVGLYPDVLGEKLSYFSPMIMMDPSINTRDLVPEIEAYVEELESAKAKKPAQKRVIVTQKELLQYSSITDFIYKKMTSVGGLIDPGYQMTDEDLKALEKLVKLEQNRRKKKRPRSKK